jgi:ABC-type Mn2+/Zn2+ transport system permease subunit
MIAMLVTPAAAAQLLTRRLPSMMATAAVIGALANVTGLYLSYYANIASGPAMVLVATAIFGVVFLFAPRRGLVWRRLAMAAA